MKKSLIVAALAAAIALPTGALAQCPVTGSELSPGITAQIYSNIVEVVAPNAAGCNVTVRVKNDEGDVLAEQSVDLPDTLSNNWTCSFATNPDWFCSDNSGSWYCDISGVNDGRICTGDDDWRHGYSALFLTDWSQKAEFFGIQPGQQIEVFTDSFLPEAVGISAPGAATHTVAEIGLTKVAPGEDAVAGFVHPRMGTEIVASFLGLDMNGGLILGPGPASPICLGMQIPLADDGSFAEDFTGECNLLRNGAMLFEYYKKNFRIYRFEHIPGIAAIINTPFALHSGQMYVPYRAHLQDGQDTHKAWSTSRPLAWLNLGIFQFSRHQSAVPIRKKDKIHLSQFAPYGNGVEGEDFIDAVPKFGISVATPPAEAANGFVEQWVLTAPVGKTVCFTCIGCHDIGPDYVNYDCTSVKEEKESTKVGAGGTGTIFLGDAPDAILAIMQKGNGNFYVAHKGLQNPLSTLLTQAPVIPSMYGFIPWLFCDALGGSCGITETTETPRLARAELAGYLKKK